jgi:hypothetical protein
MKTRSSSGVGMKVDLSFNVDTLRIEDLGEDDQEQATAGATNSASSIVNSIKRSSSNGTPDEGEPVKKINAEADSAKLRSFLNNLGNE